MHHCVPLNPVQRCDKGLGVPKNNLKVLFWNILEYGQSIQQSSACPVPDGQTAYYGYGERLKWPVVKHFSWCPSSATCTSSSCGVHGGNSTVLRQGNERPALSLPLATLPGLDQIHNGGAPPAPSPMGKVTKSLPHTRCHGPDHSGPHHHAGPPQSARTRTAGPNTRSCPAFLRGLSSLHNLAPRSSGARARLVVPARPFGRRRRVV